TMLVDLSIHDRSVPVQISMKSSISGDQMVYWIALMDLTETRMIETELRDTLTNWFSLVESAPDVIMTVNSKAKITYVNRNIWGYTTRTLAGTRLTAYVMERDRRHGEKCIASASAADQPLMRQSGTSND